MENHIFSLDTVEALASHFLNKFSSKHDLAFSHWVGDRLASEAVFHEYVIPFDALVYDILTKQPKKNIFDWLDSDTVSYQTYCKYGTDIAP